MGSSTGTLVPGPTTSQPRRRIQILVSSFLLSCTVSCLHCKFFRHVSHVCTVLNYLFFSFLPTHRHWRELSISPAYELTLLRWELQTQKDLGRSILDLITGLSKQAAKEALQYTTAGLLLAAISLPMTLVCVHTRTCELNIFCQKVRNSKVIYAHHNLIFRSRFWMSSTICGCWQRNGPISPAKSWPRYVLDFFLYFVLNDIK